MAILARLTQAPILEPTSGRNKLFSRFLNVFFEGMLTKTTSQFQLQANLNLAT